MLKNIRISEEKSIASISVVRLTSPTPSMVDQEETERLEELERFMQMTSDGEDSDKETDNDSSQSGCEEVISEKDHVTGDDNDNTGGENNGDSTETEAEVPKVKKRPGRKPKPPKKQKKRRKPKERPQIVGLSVEQFYAENTADVVVKNALSTYMNIKLFKEQMNMCNICRTGWIIDIQTHTRIGCSDGDYSKRSQLHSIHLA